LIVAGGGLQIPNVPFDAEVEDALRVACAHLQLPIGIISRIEGTRYTICSVVAPPDVALEAGQELELGHTFCELVMSDEDGLVTIEQAGDSHRKHPCYEAFGLESYVGVRIEVNGAPYGTLSLSSPAPRSRPWGMAEKGLARLVAAWAARALERDQLLDRLDRSHGRFRAMFEALPEPIVIHRWGVIIDANPATAQLLGADLSTLRGRSLIDFLAEDDDRVVVAQRLERMARGEPAGPPLEISIRTDAGELRWVETLGVPLELESGRAMLTIARDVTARRERVEAQLMRSDRLASLGTLAAGIAHELNNPLAYVIGNLEVALEGLSDERGTELASTLEEARHGALRARKIVRDLRIFARDEANGAAPGALHAALAGAIKMAMGELRHRGCVVTDLGPEMVVDAGASRLTQVFVNLLVNAAQALPEGDPERHEVRVETRSTQPGWAEVRIADTGPGFAEDVLPRIFEPFFTTKPPGEGTGLGLSMSRRIVEELGGELTAANRPEGGAELRVRLPLRAEPVEEAPAPSRPPSIAPVRGRVLVVDDDVMVGRSVRRVLGRWHEVEVVDSGQAALAKLLEDGVEYDAILCDLMMPGLSGWDVHAALASERPDLVDRLVFMTGGTLHERGRAFLGEVGRPHLTKPFELDVIRAVVGQVVERSLGSAGRGGEARTDDEG